jgi:hypothetical protein
VGSSAQSSCSTWPGPVAGALGGALATRTQLAQAALDDVHRALVTVLAQDLGHARRLDLGPLLEHAADQRLERIEHRAWGARR